MKNLTWNMITSEVYNSTEDRQTINLVETKLTYIPVGDDFVPTPRIMVCLKKFEKKRKRRTQCQSVTDQREVNKRVKLEKREDALQRNS